MMNPRFHCKRLRDLITEDFEDTPGRQGVLRLIDVIEGLLTDHGICPPTPAALSRDQRPLDLADLHALTSKDEPPGAHDHVTDGAGRAWLRDANDNWWQRPTEADPWYLQRGAQPEPQPDGPGGPPRLVSKNLMGPQS